MLSTKVGYSMRVARSGLLYITVFALIFVDVIGFRSRAGVNLEDVVQQPTLQSECPDGPMIPASFKKVKALSQWTADHFHKCNLLYQDSFMMGLRRDMLRIRKLELHYLRNPDTLGVSKFLRPNWIGASGFHRDFHNSIKNWKWGISAVGVGLGSVGQGSEHLAHHFHGAKETFEIINKGAEISHGVFELGDLRKEFKETAAEQLEELSTHKFHDCKKNAASKFQAATASTAQGIAAQNSTWRTAEGRKQIAAAVHVCMVLEAVRLKKYMGLGVAENMHDIPLGVIFEVFKKVRKARLNYWYLDENAHEVTKQVDVKGFQHGTTDLVKDVFSKELVLKPGDVFTNVHTLKDDRNKLMAAVLGDGEGAIVYPADHSPPFKRLSPTQLNTKLEQIRDSMLSSLRHEVKVGERGDTLDQLTLGFHEKWNNPVFKIGKAFLLAGAGIGACIACIASGGAATPVAIAGYVFLAGTANAGIDVASEETFQNMVFARVSYLMEMLFKWEQIHRSAGVPCSVEVPCQGRTWCNYNMIYETSQLWFDQAVGKKRVGICFPAGETLLPDGFPCEANQDCGSGMCGFSWEAPSSVNASMDDQAIEEKAVRSLVGQCFTQAVETKTATAVHEKAPVHHRLGAARVASDRQGKSRNDKTHAQHQHRIGTAPVKNNKRRKSTVE